MFSTACYYFRVRKLALYFSPASQRALFLSLPMQTETLVVLELCF